MTEFESGFTPEIDELQQWSESIEPGLPYKQVEEALIARVGSTLRTCSGFIEMEQQLDDDGYTVEAVRSFTLVRYPHLEFAPSTYQESQQDIDALADHFGISVHPELLSADYRTVLRLDQSHIDPEDRAGHARIVHELERGGCKTQLVTAIEVRPTLEGATVKREPALVVTGKKESFIEVIIVAAGMLQQRAIAVEDFITGTTKWIDSGPPSDIDWSE